VRWQRTINARIYGGVLPTREALIFGAFDGRLYALDRGTGAVRWRHQTSTSIRNESQVYDEAGNFTPDFMSLSQQGKFKEAEARILALGGIPGTPVLAGSLILFGSTDGTLYAIRAAH
jgi:outer membrane protein assembly factor BamB